MPRTRVCVGARWPGTARRADTARARESGRAARDGDECQRPYCAKAGLRLSTARAARRAPGET
jgi:hypothetical protein